MVLTKLKFAFAAVLTVAVMAGGVAYRSGPPTASAQAAKPQSELEALRKENELLKLNLRVVLEKVKAQEAELATLKGPGKSALDQKASDRARLLELETTRVPDTQLERKAEDGRLKAVEDALKFLREARVKKSEKMERDALDALEKATNALRGRPQAK